MSSVDNEIGRFINNIGTFGESISDVLKALYKQNSNNKNSIKIDINDLDETIVIVKSLPRLKKDSFNLGDNSKIPTSGESLIIGFIKNTEQYWNDLKGELDAEKLGYLRLCLTKLLDGDSFSIIRNGIDYIFENELVPQDDLEYFWDLMQNGFVNPVLKYIKLSNSSNLLKHDSLSNYEVMFS